MSELYLHPISDDELFVSFLLTDTPPKKWETLCSTLNQKTYFERLREDFYWIFLEWYSIITFQPSPLDRSNPWEEGAKLKAKELYALFLCLREAWHLCEGAQIKFSDGRIFTLESIRLTMGKILTDSAASNLDFCLKPYSEISPQSANRHFAKTRKGGKIRKILEKPSLSKKERQKLKQFEADCWKYARHVAFDRQGRERIPLQFTIENCLKKCVKKDPRLKDDWDDYKRKQESWAKHMSRLCRTAPGVKWVKGVVSPLS